MCCIPELSFLNKLVKVTVDRQLGTSHPRFPNIIYPINYGYIDGTIGGDGMPIDAYIIDQSITKGLEKYTGFVIAVVHRKNDKENKLIVSSKDAYKAFFTNFSNVKKLKEEIYRILKFQEQYFDSEIILSELATDFFDKIQIK